MAVKTIDRLLAWAVFLSLLGLGGPQAQGAPPKVLVVMSYEPEFEWVANIKEGAESVLGQTASITYFHMDTKRNIEGGPQKAKEAYALYQKLRPDGVIAADDNAQSMFVVPYLKDKVKTPVMFCGVSAKPERYGYPASNVSGILERQHISQSLAFAQQLLPPIKSFGYIVFDSPSGRAISEYIQSKAHTFPLSPIAGRFPKTLQETREMAEELNPLCDVIYVSTMHGIKDETGAPLSDKAVLPILAKAYGKPIIGGIENSIQYGILCGVMRTGQEHGETAARMLRLAMEGRAVTDIPIVRNHVGKVMLNVTVMKSFGITPKPMLLRRVELVEMDQR